jgi:hypothetical protein
MMRKKVATLSLLALAAALYTVALVSAPAPAQACAWVCTGGTCAGGKLQARNSCTGQVTCVSACITP